MRQCAEGGGLARPHHCVGLHRHGPGVDCPHPAAFPRPIPRLRIRLYYNFHRYYDPGTGRYTSPDPLGLGPADNPVAYVHNPHTSADPLGLAECLGLRDEAQQAIERFENIKKDPLGEINSQPNHNHYDAARREAKGEVVARKPDGTPFDHIADLTQAKDGLERIRKTLQREIAKPPDTITERGIEVLLAKHKEVTKELDRLKGFLHSIGH